MLIKYENLGKNGKPNTKTRCLIECNTCNKQLWRLYKTFKKHHNDPLIGNDFCHSCMMNLDGYKHNMSKAINKMIELDPNWKVRNSKSKKGKINLGDKNGMKQPEARRKVSKTRQKKFKEDPEFRKAHANMVSKAWSEGKFDNVAVGKCQWYDYEKKDGTVCKVQGRWELAYAKWLDQNNVKFITHRGRIPYTKDGINKSYYPDFYLPDDDMYVDVKNKYHYSLNEEKFDLIMEQNTNIKIKILFKKDLQDLGVKIEDS